MTEYMHGPVLPWQPSEADSADIKSMLESEDELYRAYGAAYQAGCFVKEFGNIAAVGEMDKIAEIAFRLDKTTDEVIEDLTIGDCFNMAYPGRGDTRAEGVLDGLESILGSRMREHDSLDLFGNFSENGYRVEAYMPRNPRQETQWTVRVYREGEEELFKEVTLPMMHEPIFGVDISDQQALEARVNELMRELS